MAVADTAALIASLELQDKFSKTAAKYDSAVSGMEKKTSGFQKTLGKVGDDISKGVGTTVKNIEKLGVAAGGFLVAQVKFGIDELQKLDDVTTQTNAVLKSTKGVAGETATSIRSLAQKYEDLNATIDDKVIQSGENLLLTFTNIKKNAFEPALQAALNLNQALGGGEEGLQGVIIQVGKALNDPIKGLTALRRVGVSFTTDEIKQIKTLVAHNKLYAAQKIILGELSTQFGGSFAKAGDTATAKFAALGDAVRDLQAAFATALLPTIVEAAKELTKFLRDPGTIKGVQQFGQQLSDGFKTAVAWVKKLDFNAIRNALSTAANFAKTVISAFASAPAWLQEAVITGWGLNKISGGAVTSIFGDLAKGIGGQIFSGRGSTPANPLFVSNVGPGGTPGVPGGVIGAGEGTLGASAGVAGLSALAAPVAIAAVAIAASAAIPVLLAKLFGATSPAGPTPYGSLGPRSGSKDTITAVTQGGTRSAIGADRGAVNANANATLTRLENIKDSSQTSAAQLKAIRANAAAANAKKIADLSKLQGVKDAAQGTAKQVLAAAARAHADALAMLNKQIAANQKLADIKDKDSSITVKVTVPVSANSLNKTIIRSSGSVSPGEPPLPLQRLGHGGRGRPAREDGRPHPERRDGHLCHQRHRLRRSWWRAEPRRIPHLPGARDDDLAAVVLHEHRHGPRLSARRQPADGRGALRDARVHRLQRHGQLPPHPSDERPAAGRDGHRADNVAPEPRPHLRQRAYRLQQPGQHVGHRLLGPVR